MELAEIKQFLVGADTTQLPTPPFGSESPDTTALEFLKKEFNSLIDSIQCDCGLLLSIAGVFRE